MEESISRLAGSYHGTRLDPHELVGAAHRAGRPAAERTTLYEIRRRYPVGEPAIIEPSSERANWPWKPNGMWWGSDARASSERSLASSTSSSELPASASSTTESRTP